jgi:hypothetical protein
MMAPPPLAVIPVVIVPLSLLAMLLTALLAGPLAGLRRWWVVLNVAVVCAALYVARFTFEGVCRRLAETDAWWARPVAFWLALSLIATAGAAWVWYRGGTAGGHTATGARAGEKLVLALLSGACVGGVGYRLWGGYPDWHLLLVVSVPVWVGTLSATLTPRLAPARLMPQEAMLWTLALACATLGAVSWLT